jgi:hypothetical protein
MEIHIHAKLQHYNSRNYNKHTIYSLIMHILQYLCFVVCCFVFKHTRTIHTQLHIVDSDVLAFVEFWCFVMYGWLSGTVPVRNHSAESIASPRVFLMHESLVRHILMDKQA